ncbi:UPF0210 protein SSU05 [Streptococcus pneumoniae]|nr:UPF0210 protein SSU05 [Streptococcus pneumoniae]VKA65206.1 UPF0210 protein SSU05 [Streptococcus pneumoniae]VKF60552.1 UPF0210 protein SSU05 [Streptococcus pneumoniae]VKO77949.1 UPF0210 protein SSU05 [Streptococcus pneumoniae]VKT28392.1 UPF0210 protein SSU05 [Streptococcus pneumoniae]
MKAIITVVGKDKSGIVAGVSGKIAELGLNIDDISQTVLDEYFMKTTAVRIIPKGREGDMIEFGGLLGTAPVMKVNGASSVDFISRGGQIPAPIHSFKN